MSGAVEHVLEAERMLRLVEGRLVDDPAVPIYLSAAQIHATLAVAILGLPSVEMTPEQGQVALTKAAAELLGMPEEAAIELMQPWGPW